ncbi:uncharacterized protein MAM_07419 [Metarhizium album ARSEF 1941]|uniref:Copper acquisition factor BIM1-like domain-containing protein n=1 Tax=Metarhizium album (strain ARSEF 1941) TaxID=1081103 RepID=A0A0B2WLX2_METAS|nr:uncharacterized protein MAM_07419 [Metarhizium album ARSEF 1941]KHN94664.1 hypothetical protein MAM_07419 [Metarhizium album ARSEF 1941]
MLRKLVLGLAAVHGATAHFGLKYPPWRADTLSAEGEAKYTQWKYPCAGVDYKAGKVTDWPLKGGPLELDLHHAWSYVFVNLGLGENATNFNVSLTPQFWNVTGKGTVCVDKLPVPIDVQDGAMASLQVVTTSASGAALYNCADIRFSKDARSSSNCTSSKGVEVHTVGQGAQTTGAPAPSGTSGAKNSAAAAAAANLIGVVAGVVALASGFAVGL